jgi:hypothetical protein
LIINNKFTKSSFSELEYTAKKSVTRRDRFLLQNEAATPWSSLIRVIAPHYPSRGGRGRPEVGLEQVLHMYVAQQYFRFSEEATEDALYVIQLLPPRIYRTKFNIQSAKMHQGCPVDLIHFCNLQPLILFN